MKWLGPSKKEVLLARKAGLEQERGCPGMRGLPGQKKTPLPVLNGKRGSVDRRSLRDSVVRGDLGRF